MKLNKTIQYLLVLSLGGLLTSCLGQSSNPMEKYSNLKTGLPTSEVSETQVYAPDVFTSATPASSKDVGELKIQGPNEVNTANFIEGQDGILYFKVAPKSLKITEYTIEITDFPISTRPVLKNMNINNVFGLQWTPPLGVIPAGQLYVALQLKLKTTVTKATDANLIGLVKSDEMNLIVSRDNSVPKILGRTKLDAGLDEGQVVAFTVDIEDPASARTPNFPGVQISSYIWSNTEAFRADGAQFLQLDYSKKVNPEKLPGSATQWRFYYLLKLDPLPLDRDRRGIEDPLAPAVDVCFHLHAVSVLQTQSGKQQICFKARYAAQMPELIWENESVKEVKAGATSILKFKIQSSNGLGEVSLKDAAKQIAILTGKKDILCAASSEKSAVQDCTLTWTPTCLKSPLTRKLKLKIDNVVGKKTKSQTFSRDFVIVPSEEHCPTPVPAAKPAVKPAAQTPKPAAQTPAQPKAPESAPQGA